MPLLANSKAESWVINPRWTRQGENPPAGSFLASGRMNIGTGHSASCWLENFAHRSPTRLLFKTRVGSTPPLPGKSKNHKKFSQKKGQKLFPRPSAGPKGAVGYPAFPGEGGLARPSHPPPPGSPTLKRSTLPPHTLPLRSL